METAFEDEIVADGVIAQDQTQMDSFWSLREGLPEALMKEGKATTFKYDVSLPMKDFYDLVVDTRNRLSGLSSVVSSGRG